MLSQQLKVKARVDIAVGAELVLIEEENMRLNSLRSKKK